MRKLLLILCCLVYSLFSAHLLLADGNYFELGTPDSKNGSADAINFSQGRVWTIDRHDKYIWLTQARPPEHHWAWSNDLGATWTQGSESYQYLTRASVAYDPKNDKLHAIWAPINPPDGILYRRYGITRDGSNNITAITQEDAENINLKLDSSESKTLAQPVAVWVDDGSSNGLLVAIWEKYGEALTQVRASMRQLSLTSDDGVAANWAALDGSADVFETDAPAVAADIIYGSTIAGAAVPAATVRGGSGSRKDDLYVFVAQTVAADTSISAFRGVWNSSSKNWSGGWQAPVVVGQINSYGGGYSLKYELITKPVLDPVNDRLWIGWARWKDATAGDTVSVAYLDSEDAASQVIDVYSANGAHSYAPTIDIAFDALLETLYVAYVLSTTNGDNGSIEYKTYDGSTLSSASRFYTTTGGAAGANGSADIPILYGARSSNDRLLVGFRKNGALPPTDADPHTIYWGYLALATPTPTPNPTSTPPPSPTATATSQPQASAAPVASASPEAQASSPGWFGSLVKGIGDFFSGIRDFFN